MIAQPVFALRPTGCAQRLRLAVLAHLNTPFAWGVHDCCLWAAACVETIARRDPMADLRGRYRSATGAGRLLRRLGGLEHVAAARLGPEIEPHQALDGDVCLLARRVQTSAHGALGVLWHGQVLAPGKAGLIAHPTTAALRWWRTLP